MKHMTTYATLASAGLLGCAMVALAQDPSNSPPTAKQPAAQPPARMPAAGPHAGFMETPRYAQRLDAKLGENAIEIYTDKDFKGTQTTLENVLKSNQAGTLNAYPEKFDNDASSIRWNFAPGVLVVLYDDASGKGVQLALWGKGQIPDLSKTDFNDAASRWAWYDVGGGAEPRSQGAMHMPFGSQALDATVADNAVQLFDDENFQNNQDVISVVPSQKPGDWHTMPGKMENSVSSMRWNLPEGVVLIISAKDDGNKDIVIFGQAQFDDLSKIDFDNRSSRWAWAYIGSPTTDAKNNQPRKP